MVEIFERIIRKNWLQHISFWITSYVVLLTIFAYEKDYSAVDFIYTGLFHISLLSSVYINVRILIPRFLEQRAYLTYLLLIMIVSVIGVAINYFTFNYLSDWMFPGYYFIESYGLKDLFKFISVYLIVSSLLKFSKSWFRQLEQENLIAKIEKEKKAAEVQALKSQISPHFLLNSLNSIYSLSLEKDQRTSDSILQISEMMKFVLYETNVELISLEQEIRHIENYISFQRLRLEHVVEIFYELKGKTSGKHIAPLMLLPLIENAFKHFGARQDVSKYVKIAIQVINSDLIVKVENSVGLNSDNIIEEKGGFGLYSLKQRLDLLYFHSHELSIDEDEERYIIVLKITL